MTRCIKKCLFCDALKAGHIDNNDIIPHSGVRVVEEAYYRNFDLLVAAMLKEPIKNQEHNNNLFVRTSLLEAFAKSVKCSIDCIKFYPVEIKSDEDALDERLPNQIVDATLAFGMSILVLDKIHARKARGLGKFLPATII